MKRTLSVNITIYLILSRAYLHLRMRLAYCIPDLSCLPCGHLSYDLTLDSAETSLHQESPLSPSILSQVCPPHESTYHPAAWSPACGLLPSSSELHEDRDNPPPLPLQGQDLTQCLAHHRWPDVFWINGPISWDLHLSKHVVPLYTPFSATQCFEHQRCLIMLGWVKNKTVANY